MNQLTKIQLQEIVSKVKCTIFGISFRFHVRYHKESPYLQITFYAPDVNDPTRIEEQFCRKWVLQYVMTPSEVVRTCYKAAEAAILHELQEEFKYSDVPIYNPHWDVEQLVINLKTDTRHEFQRDHQGT
jgi:hypothetical protein